MFLLHIYLPPITNTFFKLYIFHKYKIFYFTLHDCSENHYISNLINDNRADFPAVYIKPEEILDQLLPPFQND
jgi:hypothetical protein